MKQIAPNYSYNKTTGVITLTGVNIDRDQLLLIINTTRNVTYYNFADSATTLQAFTKGANTSVTLASSVVSASSAHTNADALTIYYDDQVSSGTVTANVDQNSLLTALNLYAADGQDFPVSIKATSSDIPISGTVTANIEVPYIRVNINVENINGTIVSNVFLRRIGEYSYESIRYQGNEDEAYLKVILEVGGESTQKIWRLYSLGYYADVTGLVAFVYPQNAGSENGDPLPPKTGWTLEAGITGYLSISHEQPAIQPVTATNLAHVISTSEDVGGDAARLVAGIFDINGLQFGDNKPFPISGTVTANAGGDFANSIENVNDVGNVGKKIAVQLYDDNGSAVGVAPNPLPISGTVTANVQDLTNCVEAFDEAVPQSVVAVHLKDLSGHVLGTSGTPLPISGTVTSLAGGETPTSGTVTLTNDTRSEINTEGFGHIAFEIVSSGVAWSPSNGVVAQAYNGTAPSNADIFAPAGIRYRHSTDTSVPTFNNIYFNLGLANPSEDRAFGSATGNAYGTSLVRLDHYGNTAQLALQTNGTRYFLFDLTTSRFALRPFFTAGSVTVKYRLYKGKHPFFSARNIIVRGENPDGRINVTVPDAINANVVYAVQDGDGTTFGVDRSFPIDGTVTANNNTIDNYFGLSLEEVGEQDAIFAVRVQGSNLSPLPVTGTVTANLSESITELIDSTNATQAIAVHIKDADGNNWGAENIFPVVASGTVTANTFAVQGTAVTTSNFTSTTASTLLAAANSNRKVLTIFNEGAGNLHICAGATCTTSAYQVRLSAGDYYEVPNHQTAITHSAVFATAGTARVTEVS